MVSTLLIGTIHGTSLVFAWSSGSIYLSGGLERTRHHLFDPVVDGDGPSLPRPLEGCGMAVPCFSGLGGVLPTRAHVGGGDSRAIECCCGGICWPAGPYHRSVRTESGAGFGGACWAIAMPGSAVLGIEIAGSRSATREGGEPAWCAHLMRIFVVGCRTP